MELNILLARMVTGRATHTHDIIIPVAHKPRTQNLICCLRACVSSYRHDMFKYILFEPVRQQQAKYRFGFVVAFKLTIVLWNDEMLLYVQQRLRTTIVVTKLAVAIQPPSSCCQGAPVTVNNIFWISNAVTKHLALGNAPKTFTMMPPSPQLHTQQRKRKNGQEWRVSK